MWRDPQNEMNDIFQVYCSKCSELCEIVEVSFIGKCKTCNNIQRFFRCMQSTCGSYVSVCPSCARYLTFEKSKKNKELPYGCNSGISNSSLKSDSSWSLVFAIGTILMIFTTCYYYMFTGTLQNKNLVKIEKLRRDYPSQKNDTWYHFLSMLEKEVPSVKTITFLHGEDRRTSDCLAKELVFLYTKNKSLKSEDITFSDFDADDYGFVLQHYKTIVQQFGVFIANLNKVSGNVARIFHWLCDDVSSEIKPSLFIFTVKYNERTKTLKPVERATSVLRKAWSHLPENELFPLLSRVIKNVVDVVSEHQVNC